MVLPSVVTLNSHDPGEGLRRKAARPRRSASAYGLSYAAGAVGLKPGEFLFLVVGWFWVPGPHAPGTGRTWGILVIRSGENCVIALTCSTGRPLILRMSRGQRPLRLSHC